MALSTVFFPNQPMDLYGMSGTDPSYREILQRKETIYKLAPKLNFGGSKAGTVPYWKFVDNYSGTGARTKTPPSTTSISRWWTPSRSVSMPRWMSCTLLMDLRTGVEN